jgi:transglutaminase-like putative cysteine protease
MIVAHTQTDGSALTTGQLMHGMVNAYYRDMLPFVHMGLSEVYEMIKNIPFKPDPEDAETLQRPLYTLQQNGYGGDCDDKAIAMASWAKAAGLPYRFVAVRRADHEDLHHVFTEIYTANNWVRCDCTYPFNSLGREREAYAEYVII